MNIFIHEKLTITSVILSITNPHPISFIAAFITILVGLENLRRQVVQAGGIKNYFRNLLKHWK
jgi:threonine/homoserine/homoserine lactone efflux protein